MNTSERTRQLLIEHYQTYPRMELRDLFKYLHQSSFGCEHMVSSLEGAIDYIREESQTITPDASYSIVPLDGAYSRVPLTLLKRGLSPETLGKLFCASAKTEPLGQEALEKKLEIAADMIEKGELPFETAAFEQARKEWKVSGYPAIHHSQTFREVYHPAYRVIAEEYLPFLPLFARVDAFLQEKGSLTLAIDGGAGSGKSTLASLFEKLYGCTVFHMDDFFLQFHQRTPERLAEPGGNVDRERFLEEVLLPLKKKETVQYRPFDCSTGRIASATPITPGKLAVIEGAYSMHPELAGFYDFAVFLDVDPDLQKERIRKRNSPEMAMRFFEEWIPMEQAYFSILRVKERCALSIPIKKEIHPLNII